MKHFNNINFPSIHIRLLHNDNDQDLKEFNNFLLETTDYFADYDVAAPTEDQVQEFFTDLPDNTSMDQKYFYGIFDKEQLIGFIDIVENYPQKNQSIIGYFVLMPAYRHTGLAQNLYTALEETVKETGTTELVLTVIKDDERANNFWKKQGFQITGESESTYGEQWNMKKDI